MRKVAVLAMMLAAGPAVAEPLGGDAARKALIPDKGVSVEIIRHKALPDAQAQVLATVAKGQAHYGAVAFSPDDGLMSEATVAAVDYHSTEAAAAAAAADCDARRKGRAKCVIVALIRPAAWEPRPVQMSAAAAAAFRKDYGRSGPRALALSAATGQFALAQGAEAQARALAECNVKGKGDCSVVVAD
ncbi:MAG: DUF4189 domain-containing protein [Paracoccaceae bacterium]|nr:MAG: DUF4189 domain-containing protein [Paracoccaceae bacterium]